MNLYSLLADAIRRRASDPAIRHGDRCLTYGEFDRAATAFGTFLAARGCRPGDRVLLFLRNGFEYPVLLLGAMRAGMIAVPVNAKLHPAEVAFICGDAAPKVVFVHRDQYDALHAALPAPRPDLVIIEDFALQLATETIAPAEVAPDDPAWIFYTSGTTGKPKGATLSHRNLIAASVNCLADVFAFAPSDRVLHVAPLSHGSGLYLIPAMARGTENVISDLPGFDPDAVLDLVARRRITVFAFVAPTMIVRMLDAAPRNDIGCLRGVIYGGAPIHLEHIRAAVKRFGPIFNQLYGQGETPMTISYLPAADHLSDDDELLRSAGYVRAGIEVRIVDEKDRPVPDGDTGEICVRGDTVMQGYWHNPAASAAALAGGWLHTGDIGRFDQHGRLHVLDRRHDTIISGGANIYPKEVEDAIAAHPRVREVVAFGLPDREWGQIVAVAVVAEAGLAAEEILDFCRARLASFKKPKKVFFLDELPKSAYGKILRRELRQRFAEETGAA